MITRKALQECADAGMHTTAAARHLKTTSASIGRAARKFGIKMPAFEGVGMKIADNGATAELFKKRWMDGLTMGLIGEEFGISKTTVKDTAKRLGLPSRVSWGKMQGQVIPPKPPEPEPKPLPEPPASILRPDFSAKQAIELMQCKGHTEVAAFAERHSMTLRQAQCHFHRVRAAV